MDDMNEAFRAEIDSLKAESNHLKQQLRERDRELADQRDKNEDLSAKYENAEKERTMLLTNVSFYWFFIYENCGFLAKSIRRYNS